MRTVRGKRTMPARSTASARVKASRRSSRRASSWKATGVTQDSPSPSTAVRPSSSLTASAALPTRPRLIASRRRASAFFGSIASTLRSQPTALWYCSNFS